MNLSILPPSAAIRGAIAAKCRSRRWVISDGGLLSQSGVNPRMSEVRMIPSREPAERAMPGSAALSSVAIAWSETRAARRRRSRRPSTMLPKATLSRPSSSGRESVMETDRSPRPTFSSASLRVRIGRSIRRAVIRPESSTRTMQKIASIATSIRRYDSSARMTAVSAVAARTKPGKPSEGRAMRAASGVISMTGPLRWAALLATFCSWWSNAAVSCRVAGVRRVIRPRRCRNAASRLPGVRICASARLFRMMRFARSSAFQAMMIAYVSIPSMATMSYRMLARRGPT
ncbi:MAG: hypothetical protein BWY66_01552 [bacterium ADurb.Bin374]|nr:MAG: hypothetical protein BWY66_01552 [bacterium ADurb.Bin374]